MVRNVKGNKKKSKSRVVRNVNADMIFARSLYLVSKDEIDFQTLFSFELAPVPTSPFKDDQEAQYPSNKSVLKNKLKVDVSCRGVVANAVVIDGVAMLFSVIYSPKLGMVSDLADSVDNFIGNLLISSDVYLVFDRYIFKLSIY